MPTIPVIDIDNEAEQLLPPPKRLPKFLLFWRACLSPIKRDNKYRQWMLGGADTDFYSSTFTYAQGDNTKDIYGVYESLVSDNTGNPTTDTTKWVKVLQSFVGVKELAQYTSQKLTFEYSLNRQLNGLAAGTIKSEFNAANGDIYIINVVPAYTSFVMYPDSASSSKMYPTFSTGIMFDPPVYLGATTYQFIINVPSGLYASFGAAAEQIIRQFADRYTIVGTGYTIQQY